MREVESLAGRREEQLAVPARYREASSPEADRLLADLESGAARGAWLQGPVGSGKTWAACALAIAATRSGRLGRVAFANAVAMLAAERDAMAARGRGGMGALGSAGLLVVDDLDKVRPTDWAVESLYLLLESRSGDGLPTVATANCDLSALCARLGGDAMAQAICDRLRDGARLVTFSGATRRRWA